MEKRKNIFFDFEVTDDEWLFGYMDEQENYNYILNDRQSLINFIEINKEDSIFIGFNNKYYDNYVLKCLWYNIEPSKINYWSIEQGNEPWKLPELQYKKNIPGFVTFDVFANVFGTSLGSLKEAEANMGMSIEEMPSFKIDEDMIWYNRHDCLATKKLFEAIGGYTVKQTLFDAYQLPYSLLNKSNPQIGAVMLSTESIVQKKSFKYKKPKCITIKDSTIVVFFQNHQFTLN